MFEMKDKGDDTLHEEVIALRMLLQDKEKEILTLKEAIKTLEYQASAQFL